MSKAALILKKISESNTEILKEPLSVKDDKVFVGKYYYNLKPLNPKYWVRYKDLKEFVAKVKEEWNSYNTPSVDPEGKTGKYNVVCFNSPDDIVGVFDPETKMGVISMYDPEAYDPDED